jgi:transposase
MKDHVEYLEKTISEIDGIIEKHIEPYQTEIDLLKTLPGVKDFAAAAIISEIGVDMDQFRDAPHLTAWGGMCPGSNQSAGKIKSSRIRRGNTYLKVILTQVAWAIAKTKKTYLGAKYRALSWRRGKKRAIIAIGRKALVICYHILKKKVPFHELGVDFLDNLEPERKAKYHAKRLEELGYEIKITKKVA